jgi:hypothetical protein
MKLFDFPDSIFCLIRDFFNDFHVFQFSEGYYGIEAGIILFLFVILLMKLERNID